MAIKLMSSLVITLNSDKVFVIDQKNPDTGEFDESKVMVGFDAEQAKDAYMTTYEAGWGWFYGHYRAIGGQLQEMAFTMAQNSASHSSEYVGNKKEDTSSMGCLTDGIP